MRRDLERSQEPESRSQEDACQRPDGICSFAFLAETGDKQAAPANVSTFGFSIGFIGQRHWV